MTTTAVDKCFLSGGEVAVTADRRSLRKTSGRRHQSDVFLRFRCSGRSKRCCWSREGHCTVVDAATFETAQCIRSCHVRYQPPPTPAPGTHTNLSQQLCLLRSLMINPPPLPLRVHANNNQAVEPSTRCEEPSNIWCQRGVVVEPIKYLALLITPPVGNILRSFGHAGICSGWLSGVCMYAQHATHVACESRPVTALLCGSFAYIAILRGALQTLWQWRCLAPEPC